MAKIPFAFPSLAVQERIVAKLDTIVASLSEAQRNVEHNRIGARELFKSHLNGLFEANRSQWDQKPIGDVCERLHQGLNTAGEKVMFYNSGYPIIQTRNIDDGTVELDSKMKFMSEADWRLYKDKYRPEVGDILFTNIGTIGKTAIVVTERDYLIHWNIFKLRPRRDELTSEFLRYTLEHLTESGYFKRLQKGGTVDFVTKKMISEARILLPPIDEQRSIVANLDSIQVEARSLAHLYEQKLTELEGLKKAVLGAAFRGELS